MAKLSPSRISTVVEVSRRLKALTEIPLVCTEVVVSIEDTAALITRLIVLPSTTVGVKLSSTPKGLYSMLIWPLLLVSGIGYSPPARNLASWPDSAVRFGSARVRTTPLDSSASSSTPNSSEPAVKPRPKAPCVPLFNENRLF